MRKRFDNNKHIKSISRELFKVKPSKIIKSVKNKLQELETQKEITKYLKGYEDV